jgi:hypothetical protein
MSAEFLTDFSAWLASAATLTFGTDIVCCQFGQGLGVQSYVNNTGGSDRGVRPTMPLTLQVMTKGSGPREAIARAMQLYDAIYPPPQRQPRRMVDLSADWPMTSGMWCSTYRYEQ